ncbi:hypothetical protein [Phormidesmis priestleyi]
MAARSLRVTRQGSLKPASKSSSQATVTWSKETALLGIRLAVQPVQDSTLYPQYTIGLHAWFLNQVRQTDPQLSAQLHDEQNEKPFTLSALIDPRSPQDRDLKLQASQTYHWYLTALSQPVVDWLTQWLQNSPTEIDLRTAPLRIVSWSIAHPATTYETLFGRAEFNPDSSLLPHPSPSSPLLAFAAKGTISPYPSQPICFTAICAAGTISPTLNTSQTNFSPGLTNP